jgi:galactonate dehydratase
LKIKKVETTIYETKYPQIFVSITTDEGIQGTGEAWWGLSVKPVESAIRDTLEPLLIGEDPSRIEYLWNKMFKYAYRYGTEGVILCGLSGIDLALWDLKGKQLGVPVTNLIGGLVRDCIKAYASLPPLRQEKMIIDQVKRAVKTGFDGVKLHEVKTD